MTDEVEEGIAPNKPAPASTATTIQAALQHPNMSHPLPRGARYLHHFEVDLISDGQKLLHAISDEGRQLIADIKNEGLAAEEEIANHKAGVSAPDAGSANGQKPSES